MQEEQKDGKGIIYIDTGGTFSDCVYIRGDGLVFTGKAATTPDNLAYFKVPRYVEFRDNFPRPTAVPKILKNALREEKEDLTSGCYDRGPKLKRK